MHDDSCKVELPGGESRRSPSPASIRCWTPIWPGTTWKTTFRRQTWRTCEDSGLLPHSWEGSEWQAFPSPWTGTRTGMT